MTRNFEHEISNERVELTIAPEWGARVTSLKDRVSGRQWLLEGPLAGDTSDEAFYGPVESLGWDECFPSVSPCEHKDWKGTIRDHGILWGRHWRVRSGNGESTASFDGDGFRFQRRLRLLQDGLVAHYSVRNTASSAFEYMWSQHCLLATRPGDELHLNGIGNLRVSGGMRGGAEIEPGRVEWPILDESGFDLREVRGSDADFFVKMYGEVSGEAISGVAGPDGGITFCHSGDTLPYLGIWLDYGGWQRDASIHQVAFEPTTAGADHLADAVRFGQSRRLEPGIQDEWEVRITLDAPK